VRPLPAVFLHSFNETYRVLSVDFFVAFEHPPTLTGYDFLFLGHLLLTLPAILKSGSRAAWKLEGETTK